jgi:hypothetical protein
MRMSAWLVLAVAVASSARAEEGLEYGFGTGRQGTFTASRSACCSWRSPWAGKSRYPKS